MLFSKKKIFSVIECQTKEDLTDGDKTVLKLKLRYPELQCPKNDPLLKFAKPFYEKLSKGFLEYAKGELFKIAKTASNENQKPFSALMKFEKSLENESYLSILIEISVSNGISPPSVERKTQIWDRKNGFLCKADDFVDAKTLSMLKKEHKANFDKQLFLLKEDGIEFLIGSERHFVPTAVAVC